MDAFLDRYGPWALVTGAARGLGAEFARQLARRGLGLVLLDIEPTGMTKLAEELGASFGIETRVVVLDLVLPDPLGPLLASLAGLEIGLLVNNAGISAIGHFLDLPLDRHLQVLDVNARSSVVLAHHFGRAMRERSKGGMIFVSSMSGLSGTSWVAEYSATKAHNLVLAEALGEELRGTGVDVLATAVGATDTPGWRAENPHPDAKAWPPVMSAEATVRETLGALGKRPTIVPGSANRLATFLTTRLMSRRAAVTTVGAEMRKRYDPRA